MGAPTKANVDEILRIDREFASTAAKQAAAEFDDVRTWVDPRGYRLSDRIWQSRQDVRRQIDLTLQEAVANRTDALVVAKQLEQHLNPSYALLRGPDGKILKNQPRGIVTKAPGRGGQGSYAARRLARTEISRAHAQATQKAAALTPFALGWQWNLSAQHPKPDACDANATNNDFKLGPGVYPPNAGPRMPNHPHCLCFSTIVTRDDLDNVLKELMHEYRLNDDPTELIGTASPASAGLTVDDIDSFKEMLLDLEAVNDFYAGYADVVKDATQEMHKAAKDYIGAGYKRLNYYLSGRLDEIRPERIPDVLKTLDGMDAIMRHPSAVSNADIKLYRGTSFKRGVPDEIKFAKPGDVLEDPRFGSFSMNEQTAFDFTGEDDTKSVIYEVIMPKGTRSISGEMIGGTTNLGEDILEDSEAEVVLNRGYRMRVIEVRRDPYVGVRVYAEILPEDFPVVFSSPAETSLPLGFVPSKTVDEAVDQFRHLTQITTDLGDNLLANATPEMIDRATRSIHEIQRAGGDTSDFKVLLNWAPNEGSGFYNGYMDINFADLTKEVNIPGLIDPSDIIGFDQVQYVITHEYGHIADFRHWGKMKSWDLPQVKFDKDVARKVSLYASDRRAEFIAEKFAMNSLGRTYGDDVEKMYADFLGPKPLRIRPILNAPSVSSPASDSLLSLQELFPKAVIDLKQFDPAVVAKITERANELVEKYPMLRDQLRIIRWDNLQNNADGILLGSSNSIGTLELNMAFKTTRDWEVVINKLTREGFLHSGTRDVEDIFTHELGHHLQYSLEQKYGDEIKAWVKANRLPAEYSKYGHSAPDETWAELFGMAHSIPKQYWPDVVVNFDHFLSSLVRRELGEVEKSISTFKRVTTVKDAIAEAAKYNIDLQNVTKADLSVVNYLGDTWDDLYNRGLLDGDRRVVRFVDELARAARAEHNAETDIISISRKYRHEWVDDSLTWRKVKFLPNGRMHFVGDNATSVFVHELGHQNHWRRVLDPDVFGKLPRDLLHGHEQQIFDEISTYAGSNAAEFVAETFVKLYQGETVSDDLMTLYRKYDGPPVLTRGTTLAPDIDFNHSNFRNEFMRLMNEEQEDGWIPVKSLYKDAAPDLGDYTHWRPQGVKVDNIQGIAENAGFDWTEDADKFPIKRISLDPRKITAGQPSIDSYEVRNIAAHWDPDEAKALVIKHGDEYLIVDGHHTITAAIMRGEKTLSVHVLDVTPTIEEAVNRVILRKLPTTIEEFRAIDFNGAVTGSGDLSKGKRFLEQARQEMYKKYVKGDDPISIRGKAVIDEVYTQKRKELASDYRKWLKAGKDPGKKKEIIDLREERRKAAEAKKAAREAERQAREAERRARAAERLARKAERDAEKAAKQFRKQRQDDLLPEEGVKRRPGESEEMHTAREILAADILNERDVMELGQQISYEVERRVIIAEDSRRTPQQILDELTDARFNKRTLPSNPHPNDLKALDEKIRRLEEEYDAARAATSYVDRRKAILDVINELHDKPSAPKKISKMVQYSYDKKALSAVEQALRENFPTKWVDELADTTKQLDHTFQIEVVPRGEYEHLTKSIRVSGVTEKELERVATHELAHAFEQYRPKLVQLQHEFYNRRTAGDAFTDLGGSMKGEMTKLDNWLDPYMGKEYTRLSGAPYAYELLTMGLDSLLSRTGRYNVDLQNDPEFYNFILGLLAGA